MEPFIVLAIVLRLKLGSVVIWIVIEWEPLMKNITVLISLLKSPNEFDRKFYKQGGIFI